MPFYQKLYKSKAPVWMLFLFCIPVIYSNANPLDTLVKKAAVKEIYFPELKQEPGSRDSSSFVLPFSKVGNLLLIKAKADSTEGNFVLDTGCPGLVLNITYFRSYHITESDAENLGATGPLATNEQIWIRNFHLGTMEESNVKANLANLGNIENSKGIKVLGLIGLQFLKNCELIIDYQKNLMYFHIISRKESGTYKSDLLNDAAAYHTIPFEIISNRIIVKTEMAGKKRRFVIDCAAETNVLDSRLPDKIFETLSITGKVLVVGVGNTKVEAVKGNLANFNIGDRIIKDMPVLVTNLENTCFTQGGCVDGVLGLDNLSVKKIGFNFATLKMFIWK